MKLSEVIAALQQIQIDHGDDVEVSTGGCEGDTVYDVWFDGQHGIAYIG